MSSIDNKNPDKPTQKTNTPASPKTIQNNALCAKNKPMSSTDTGNGPGWIRTSEDLRQRVYSPLTDSHKRNDDNSLQNGQVSAYKPAYKQNPKKPKNQHENQTFKMAPELAEIIEVWPSLPDSIKDAIKAIIAPYSKP